MSPAAAAAAVRTWKFGDDPGRVAEALARGAVVAIPTESSYGLAVDPLDAAGVAKTFQLKGRQSTEALPVVGANADAFEGLGVQPRELSLQWAVRFWPAALSVVVPLLEPIPASAGGRTLAVRVPAHEGLRQLLAALGRPLTATSANRSGEPPYVEPAGLVSWLEGSGVEALVVDGGRLPGGPPSTLVELVGGRPRVLRQGRFQLE